MKLVKNYKIKLTIISIFLVFIDLYSKQYFKNILEWNNLNNMYFFSKDNIINNYINLTLYYDDWIAFWIYIWNIFIKFLTLGLIIFLIYFFIKEILVLKNKYLGAWFIFIISWAIWNWIERILNWRVIDFINVKYFTIFNIADILISIGAFILIFNYVFLYDKWDTNN